MKYYPKQIDSDDSYDALKDNYLTGDGDAYNEKTRKQEREEAENDRYNY